MTKDGRKIVGARVNEDSFTVQLRLQSQEFKSFIKDDVKEVVEMKESLMPAYKGMPKNVLDDSGGIPDDAEGANEQRL